MRKKVFICDTYVDYKIHMRTQGLLLRHNHIVLVPNDPDVLDRMMGLRLSWDDITIIGDPSAKFSFWMRLQERIQINDP